MNEDTTIIEHYQIYFLNLALNFSLTSNGRVDENFVQAFSTASHLLWAMMSVTFFIDIVNIYVHLKKKKDKDKELIENKLLILL